MTYQDSERYNAKNEEMYCLFNCSETDFRATWCTFKAMPQNFFYFLKKSFSYISGMVPRLKTFLYFLKISFPYILEKSNFLKELLTF